MKMTDGSYRICTRGIWNTSIPGITFDENGASNFSKIHDKLIEFYPRGEKGLQDWKAIIKKVKERGKGKKYDCLIGVSGGVDSSYLLHIVKKEHGLRPLAVNIDNGWSSDISVQNIKKVTKTLNINLETYVIDDGEINDLLRSYMRACLPWIDIPSDIAIKSSLFKIAAKKRNKVHFQGQ